MTNSTKTLAVWGDSILKGIVQGTEGKMYSVLPDNALKLAADNFDITIINHCYFGSTVSKGKSLLQRDMERNIECDAGIIEFGGNDCDYDWTALCQAPGEHHLPRTPIEQFAERVQEMIDLLRSRGIRPVLTTLPPLVSDRYFKTISRGLDADFILKWLGDEAYLYRWHEMYSDEIIKLALKNDCFLIDLRKAFLEERNYQRLFCEDGIHPNRDGHQFIYRIFEKALLATGFTGRRTA